MPSASELGRFYRIRDWIHFLPLPLAGWLAGDAHDPFALCGGVLGWSLGLAYASALNQAFDARLDRWRRGKNPVGRTIGRRLALALAAPPAVASLVVTAVAAPSGVPAAVLLLVAATLYSAPPRLKKYPVVGTVWNLAVGLPGLFFADLPDVRQLPFRLFVGLFALLLLVSQLIHEAEDRDDDARGGVGTIATVSGARGALATALVFVACIPPATWLLADGLPLRAPVAAATCVFALAWLAVLSRRLRGDTSAAQLRRDRLAYRWAALALGALTFAAGLV